MKLLTLRIKQKLLIITILPVLGMIILSSNFIYAYFTHLQSNTKFSIYANLIKKSSDLIHNIQIERGLSIAYLNHEKSDYFKNKLQLNRINTDTDIEVFISSIKDSKILTQTHLKLFQECELYVKKLKKFRTNIDSKIILQENGYKYYTRFNHSLLDFIDSLRIISANELVATYVLALQQLFELQEIAGQERAFVLGIIRSQKISQETIYKLNILIDQEKKHYNYINNLLENSLFSNMLFNTHKKYVNSYLQETRLRITKEQLSINSQKWFNISTQRIDELHSFSHNLFKEIFLAIENEQEELELSLYMLIVFISVIILLIFYTNYYIADTIKYSVKQLDKGIKNFYEFLYFKSTLPKPIDTNSKDELNDMAQNINKEMLIIQENFEQDMEFITETTQLVQLMQDGDFSKKLYTFPVHPNLKELKVVMNKLINLIRTKIKEQTYSLEKLNISLEDKVLNQTLELQNQIEVITIARDDAIQAQVAKDEFLANMSHEIRTPLNAILGFVSILKKQIKDEKPLNYLNIIDTSGQSLLTIINDILDFSKIQSGQFHIDKHPIESVEEFSNAVMLFTSKAYEKHIIYIVYIDPNLPKIINIDSIRVKQILSNMLSNAIKFTPANGKIKVSVTIIDSNLIISVQDSGIGISKENQKKVFSAFEQADGSTTRKYGGTGLGLSISSNLAKLMNGELNLKSDYGQGSTFTLEIPIDIVDKPPLKLINTQSISKLRFALLNTCDEFKASVELIQKYLHDFGVETIFTLDTYQKDGYDVLFFVPDDEYNVDIIEAKVPAIAMLRTNTIKLAKIKHIEPLYAPFVASTIIQALNDSGIENIKVINNTLTSNEEGEIQFKGSILVVEDNKTNQMLLCLILDDYGINYTVANDGLEAVSLFKEKKFDMVLMDENMPNKNGIEAMIEIKEYESQKALILTPIIALTASALDSDKKRFMEVGMDGFIAKPINTEALEIELSKYLTQVV